MGRGKSYTIEDYEDRILLFMHTKGRSVTTKEIMEEVRGTHYRLVDGLMSLGTSGKVTMRKTKHDYHWSLRNSEGTT